MRNTNGGTRIAGKKTFFLPSKSLKKTQNSPKINHLRRVEEIGFWGRPVRVDLRAGYRKQVAKIFLVCTFICSFLLPSFYRAIYSTRVKSEGDAAVFRQKQRGPILCAKPRINTRSNAPRVPEAGAPFSDWQTWLPVSSAVISAQSKLAGPGALFHCLVPVSFACYSRASRCAQSQRYLIHNEHRLQNNRRGRALG